MYLDIIGTVEEYCKTRPEYCLDEIDVVDILDNGDEKNVFVKTEGNRCPPLFVVIGIDGFDGLDDIIGSNKIKVIPYFVIKNHHNRHIVSYSIGKKLCNLSEVREVSGTLYSRCSGSYSPIELSQGGVIDSKIALWIHDCLTGDFDHHDTLNRRVLATGVTISYDFGKCFANSHFPKDYAGELGLSGATIAGCSEFVVNQLKEYSNLFKIDEGAFISGIMETYPETGNDKELLIYFNCFKKNFPMRLYYGRLFDPFVGFPFDWRQIEPILNRAEIDIDPISDWDCLIDGLSDHQGRCYMEVEQAGGVGNNP